jgi:hypothetical protein
MLLLAIRIPELVSHTPVPQHHSLDLASHTLVRIRQAARRLDHKQLLRMMGLHLEDPFDGSGQLRAMRSQKLTALLPLSPESTGCLDPKSIRGLFVSLNRSVHGMQHSALAAIDSRRSGLCKPPVRHHPASLLGQLINGCKFEH